jgi:hypothetical protein
MPVTGRRRRLVFELADTGDLGNPRLGNEADFVPALRQVARDVDILAGHVLVDEQKLHRLSLARACSSWPTNRTRCPGAG